MSDKNALIPSLDSKLSRRLHHRLWIRVMMGLVITSLLIGAIFTTLMYRSQVEHLKTGLLFQTQLLCISLDSELSRYKSLAMQVTSRSSIRQKLESFRRSEIDLDELARFTAPRLTDAMRLDSDMVAIRRLANNGQLLVEAGTAVPASMWHGKLPDKSIQIEVPQEINGHLMLTLSAPILNRQGDRVGIDQVTFNAHRINEIIENFTQSQYGSGNVKLATATPDGVNYFFPVGDTFTTETDSIIAAEVFEALNNIEEHIHLLNFDGSDNIMVHQRLGNADWVFLYYDQSRNFFTPAWKHAGYVGISVAILALIGIVLTLLLVRPLAGRISVEADSLRHLLKDREELLGKVQFSEERFELAMLASNDGLWDWDLRTNLVYYSPRWKSMLGYEDHELENRLTTWESLVDPIDREKTLALVEECIAGKQEGFNTDYRIRHKDGHWVYVLARGTLVGDNEKQPVRMVGTHVDITEQKHLEQRLRDSEEQATLIINTAPDAIIVVGARGEMVRFNPRVEKLFGYNNSEMLGKTVEMLIPERLRTEHIALRTSYMKHAEFRDVRSHGMNSPLLGLNKGGTEFPVEASLSPVIINNEQHFVVAVKDITDRVAAEKALKDSDLRFRTLFEMSPDPACIIDGHHFVECNQATVIILGYKNKEGFLNSHPSELSPSHQPDGEESFTKAERMMNIAHKSGIHRFEWVHRRADGSTFFAEVTLSAITLQEQPVIYCTWRDITDRKKAEDDLKAYKENLEDLVNTRTIELRANQQRLETIIENLPIVFFIKDTEGRHLLVNRCYEEASGVNKDQVIGKKDHDIFPAELADAIVQRDQSVLAGKTAVTFEEHVSYADGTMHDFLTTRVPLLDEQGEAYAVFGLALDITQSKKLQQELLQAKEEAEHLASVKSDFLSNMSHEIRTPLSAVLGLSRMGQQADSLHKALKLFTKISGSGEYLLQIVNDILDFSRIEAGKLVLENQPIQLTSTVKDIVSLIEQEADDKGLKISIQLAPGLPGWVKGDALRLRQVLLNILSNAVKFTEHGEVRLEVSAQQDALQFRISDTGIGMTEDQLAQLFKPFEQADSSTTRRFGGAGLGLSISYSLVTMMAGDIQVTSTPGEGSEFLLILPLPATSPETDDSVSGLVANNRRLQGVSVLAAEDVEINRLVLEDILDQEGASYVFTENGQQALEQVKEQGANAFSVVLMDIQMPVMDGYEATRRIHEIYEDLPVIGLTAHALEEEKQRCLDAGMLDHVSKPVNTDELVSVILRHLHMQPDTAEVTTDSPCSNTRCNTMNETASNDDIIIDESALTTRYKGHETLINKLVSTFLSAHCETSKQIRAAIEERDFEKLHKIAHTLKGISGNLEAKQLSVISERAQILTDDRDEEAFTVCLKMASALDRLSNVLQARAG